MGQHAATPYGYDVQYSGPLQRVEKPAVANACDSRCEVVYDSNCASCHGPNGAGDGEAVKGLNPPPGNLVWLSQMPMVEWDPFMHWTVAEGGAQFGTAMPAFKDTLSMDDIWAVVAYIQARMPRRAK